MEKSQGLKASKRADGVDFISNMPDSILILILSRISFIGELIRTSILSRRWRYLWTSVSSLHLSYECNLEIDEFKEFVYWVLENRSVDLDSFSLDCFDHYTSSTVGRWIHMAVKRKVKQLDLTFSPKDTEESEHVDMPHCLATCPSLEELRLNLLFRCLRLHNAEGFRSLRVLKLTYVDLFDDAVLVKCFLESFPLLEDLTLLECVLCDIDLFCISRPMLKKLRVINIDNMDHALSGGIKISCPKLVDLDLKGFKADNFSFECLDSLNKAEIEPKWMGNFKSVLFPGMSPVEHLLIDVYFFSQCINAAHDPGLPNLKTLVLTTTIDAFTVDELNQILKHYPKVESLNLIIKQVFDGPEEWELHEGEARRIMTLDVKRVELFEFKGEKPKLVSNWHDDITKLEMVFSWGTKAKQFRYRL